MLIFQKNKNHILYPRCSSPRLVRHMTKFQTLCMGCATIQTQPYYLSTFTDYMFMWRLCVCGWCWSVRRWCVSRIISHKGRSHVVALCKHTSRLLRYCDGDVLHQVFVYIDIDPLITHLYIKIHVSARYLWAAASMRCRYLYVRCENGAQFGG